MTIKSQIKDFISSQSEAKAAEINTLHKLILKSSPKAKLWFSDGRNEKGKVVANPTIGYGSFMMKYAGGTTKEWFRIGVSANTTGISVYILGLADKKYLTKTFSKTIGKASVTGYCIKFKSIEDIDIDVLLDAIKYGFKQK